MIKQHGNCSYETTQASEAVLFRWQHVLAKRIKRTKRKKYKKEKKRKKRKDKKKEKKKYEKRQPKRAVLSRGQQVLGTPPRVAD